MISVAGGWDHIVFKKMPNGIADPRSNSISKACSEEFAKQQGGKEKAEEAMKFWNNSLLQEKVTEIAKSYLEKIMPSHNYPDVFVIFRKHGGKTGAELKAEGKCNTSYSQLLLRCKRFTRYQE